MERTIEESEDELELFKRDQRTALLTLDEDVIREFAKTWGFELPSDPEVFWRAVHKARTGLRSLPLDERRVSKQWLDARLSTSFDDGEIS